MDMLCTKKSFFPILDIGDNVSLFSGYAFSSKDFSEEGYPVIKIKNIQQGLVRVIENCCIDKKIITEKHKKFLLSHGDILLAMTGQGSVGRVGKLILDKYENCFLNQRVGKFIIDTDKLDKDYFYYLISTKKYEKLLFNIGSGSGQPNLSPNDIKNISIPFPKLFVQKKIAHILRTLDEKIELNKKTNETLEEIAKAIFKSWFIDFDPVRTKAEGRSTRLPDEISDLFPDSFEDSELGKIPCGWKVISLREMLDTISETYPIETKEEVVFLNTGDIESGNFLNTRYTSIKGLPGQAKKSIKKGDILFSEIRPRNNRHAYVYFDARDYVVSTKLMVLRSKDRENSLFEYFLITQKSSINYLQLLAESRSGTFPQITFSELSEIKFALPNSLQLINFFTDNYLEISFTKIQHMNKQNKYLDEMRNTLLPKLISGELRIPDAEKIIEEVGI